MFRHIKYIESLSITNELPSRPEVKFWIWDVRTRPDLGISVHEEDELTLSSKKSCPPLKGSEMQHSAGFEIKNFLDVYSIFRGSLLPVYRWACLSHSILWYIFLSCFYYFIILNCCILFHDLMFCTFLRSHIITKYE